MRRRRERFTISEGTMSKGLLAMVVNERAGSERPRNHFRVTNTGMRTTFAVAIATMLLLVSALPAVASTENNEVPEMDTPPTTVPAVQDSSSRSVGGSQSLLADCQGCTAAYGLWDGVFNIRALRESRTNEVVSRIHVHGSIIKAFNDSCAGDWRFGESVDDFALTQFNTNAWQTHDQTYGQGSQNSWGNAGAHEWSDDGSNFSVGAGGETDLCKTF